MKYVFFGTPEFAATILEKLVHAGFTPLAVISNPDRPFGRKKIITPPPTKVLAGRYGIPVLQPEISGIKNWESEIKKITRSDSLDFFVVAAYANIIPRALLAVPKLGSIGVHPSLLPKYRGSSPIQSALLRDESETGVTLYLMDEKIDHGPILANARCPITAWDTYETLHEKLGILAGNLLVATLPRFLKGEVTPQPQNDAEATFTKKFTNQDGFVDEKTVEQAATGESPQDATEIQRKIRALNPEPGVWTLRSGKRIKFLDAEIVDGRLRLKTIHEEGKKPRLL